MRRHLPLLAALGVLIVVIILLLRPNTTTTNAPAKETIRVVASFYPLAEFARQVGGEAVNVNTITPAGTEPHDYEPTAQQLQAIYAADVFLYNGNGVDAWAERIAEDVAAKGTRVVNMSQSIDAHYDDPHFWLDPVLATQEITIIRDTFIKANPVATTPFTEQAQSYAQHLSALDNNYRTGLADCDNRYVVTSHAALTYLANEYQFTVVPITGLSPEDEPSAGRLADITQIAKEHNIKYIYFETLVSPKLAEALAREVGAQTLVFNPLEGLNEDEMAQGKTYLTVMEENLNNLRIGMLCR